MKLYAGFVGAMVLMAQPPQTERKPVTDTYHGVKVTDDYRWLENFGDPAVMAWANAQNASAQRVYVTLGAAEVVQCQES